jgi:hypothetical protein
MRDVSVLTHGMCLGLGCLAALYFAHAMGNGTPKAPPAIGTAEGHAPLTVPNAAVERTPSQPRPRSALPTSASSGPAPEAIEPSPAPERRRRAGPAPSENERREYAALVFEQEPYDATWSTESRRTLATKLEPLAGNGTQVRAVECRSSLCRIVLRQDDADVGEEFVRTFIHSNVWPGAGTAIRGEPDAQGARELVLYLAKQGAALPDVNAPASRTF